MTDRDTITRTRARASGAEESIPPGGASSSPLPDTERGYCARAEHRRDNEMHEGWMQTGHRMAHAGSKLKLPIIREGTA